MGTQINFYRINFLKINSQFLFAFPGSKIFLVFPPPCGGGNTQKNWNKIKILRRLN